MDVNEISNEKIQDGLQKLYNSDSNESKENKIEITEVPDEIDDIIENLDKDIEEEENDKTG